MTERIEGQVEQFAPGFATGSSLGDTRAGCHEAHDANYIGGDINGGIEDIRHFSDRGRRSTRIGWHA